MTQAHRTPLTPLFPAINPYSSGYLSVGDGHELYWEQCGNPDGIPLIFLHGGPGGGISPLHRRFFDPDAYRIILFDQRGAGKSMPHASTHANTRRHLVDDMEKLRAHFKIDRWHVFGGSWGSTLALSYAVQHPHRCRALILRGIFLLTQNEIDWWLHGVRRFFPESWEKFAHYIPEEERGDLLTAYHKRLNSGNAVEEINAAIQWALYESAMAALIPHYETITTAEQQANALCVARLECHYFLNEVIAPENSLLAQIDTIRHIPAAIIHGRYDCICPLETAHALHTHWPEADYIVVPDGGHGSLDPAIRSRLIEATEAFKTL